MHWPLAKAVSEAFIFALPPAETQALFRDSRLHLHVAVTDEGKGAEAVRDGDRRVDGVKMSVVAMAQRTDTCWKS